jgi:hypothetical protein
MSSIPAAIAMRQTTIKMIDAHLLQFGMKSRPAAIAVTP